ncbi:MAG: hypothetical protein BWK79_18200 [Beggiatoa sp. IS2]|nr:MAG: hypothetical protein BWK79_18200 [Beggiatoa sp. IS2]
MFIIPKPIFADLTTQLSVWEQVGLNEAQTRQAIILHVLSALGYDVWNPLEVFAEKNSGKGVIGYTPDFTIFSQEQPCFIIKVKALNKELTDNDCTQAVNYINSSDLRWAVLTNGKEWLFFDNKESGAAVDKQVLILVLDDPYFAHYLEQLLAPVTWQLPNAGEQVARNVQLIKIVVKLVPEIRCYAATEQGLRRAIEHELKNESERKLAQSRLPELMQWFFSAEEEPTPAAQKAESSEVLTTEVPSVPVTAPPKISTTEVAVSSPAPVVKPPVPTKPPVVSPLLAASSSEFLHLLYQKLVTTGQQSKLRIDNVKNPVVIRFGGTELKVSTWRDIYIGIAETRIALCRETAMRFVVEHEINEKYRDVDYRRLSNGKYISVNLNVDDVKKAINKLLTELQCPKNTMEVHYKGQIFHSP